ncbi:MAG: tRNA pseudouridine(38-40) synthase TruA [Ruminococcaceae bacterium]|nr:tRNA pseudouridine(38-40) synthase TruA [Oscillospiraceae bacterium]
MKNYLLTLMYDGSLFHGWQVQNNALTVQSCLQDAVEKILSVRENVTGCSRTDSGVHANMFCCNMRTDREIDTALFKKSLNAVLHTGIAVTEVKEVPYGFHARYNCVSKEYKYLIFNRDYNNPFYSGRALMYPYKIDAELLDNEARDFLGTHDFTSFCAANTDTEDKIRTVKAVSFKRENDFAVFTVEADGFLYNMVRIMTGTLLDINSGKIKPGSIPEIIAKKDRAFAGVTAKPCGLYLNKVNYDL